MSGLALDVGWAAGAFALEAALEVAPGETVAVAGPSGAGKTSLLRAVAGLLPGVAGTVACGGETWLGPAGSVPPERRRVGVLFQDYALFPHLTARGNVRYGLRRGPRAERERRAAELLDELGVAPLADRRPGGLSGGERQRVALARALAPEPAALLLDEPLSALDARTRRGAARLLIEVVRRRAVPVLVVTHDFAEAALLGDRVAVLEAGRVVQDGPPAELAARPASGFVAELTGAVVLLGEGAPGPDGLTAVRLDGGGVVHSTDARTGRVAVSVRPWEITLGPPGEAPRSSAQNRLAAEVRSLADQGGRVRVGLDAGQPLVAEITRPGLAALDLAVGDRVAATWKAAATRLSEI